jgi:uncharacterized membrane protein YtjA (UPF0391 family)
MLRFSVIAFVVALVSGVFGFTSIAPGAAGAAKALFFVSGILFLVFLVSGIFFQRRLPEKL